MYFIYANADQFANKRDLLMAQIADSQPDIILITEMLLKTTANGTNLALFMIPGYTLYTNFSFSDFGSISHIRGSSSNICFNSFQATQVLFDSQDFNDHVWVNVQLQGSDNLLIGCVYHSPSTPINSSVLSLCELFRDIKIY